MHDLSADHLGQPRGDGGKPELAARSRLEVYGPSLGVTSSLDRKSYWRSRPDVEVFVDRLAEALLDGVSARGVSLRDWPRGRET
jgi:hypothetical protein